MTLQVVGYLCYCGAWLGELQGRGVLVLVVQSSAGQCLGGITPCNGHRLSP